MQKKNQNIRLRKIDNKKGAFIMIFTKENNIEIFRLLNKKDNDMISQMNNSDRVQFMMTLRKYLLELRKTINIDKNIKFGTEIEFEDANREKIEIELYGTFPNYDWIVKEDKSLYKGAEAVSKILSDTEETWNSLNEACNIISNNAKIVSGASAHIHVCMNILGNNPKYWRNFAKLWMTYESVIYRFLYGEYTSPREQIGKYAKPISKDLIDDFNRIEDRSSMQSAFYILKVLNKEEDRRKAINFTNADKTQLYKYNSEADKNTIECRVANGTFNPIIWQNNINLFIKLLEYSKREDFNEEIINKRLKDIQSKEIPSNLYKYSQINTEIAIELADLIFTNNLDKIYFLRQYLKDMTVSTKPLTKSKSFTI